MAIPDPATTDWVPIWHPESAGAQGPPGATGPQGPQGPAGINGTAAPHHITHEPGGSDALVNAAWTNKPNVFTDDQTIANSIPALTLTDTDQPIDQRVFQFLTSAQVFYLQAKNDAFNLVNGSFSFDRSGNVVISGNFQAHQLAAVASDAFVYLINTIAAVDNGTWRLRVFQDGGLYFEKMTDAGITIIQHSFQPDGTMIHNGPYIRSGGFNLTNQVFANPAVLDYYEEGTWTPALQGDFTNATGQVYSIQYGYYTRIGNTVQVTFDVQISNIGTGGNGALYITGFPFVCENVINSQVFINYFTGLAVGASMIYAPGLLVQGISNCLLQFKNSSSQGVDGNLTYSVLGNGTRFSGSCSYRVP